MPNLHQLRYLHQKYNKIEYDLFIEGLSELPRTDEAIESFLEGKCAEKLLKSINRSNKPKDVQLVLEFLSNRVKKKNLLKDFESNASREVVLLYIDIGGFSQITQEYTQDELLKYINDYYSIVIPTIYKYNGEIEKTMGDGIIAVFGKPFINKEFKIEFELAYKCSKEIIKAFHKTDKQVKIALHSGEVKYYKCPIHEYEEYTMFGKAVTELFRLESVSSINCINFYTEIYLMLKVLNKLKLISFQPSNYYKSLKHVSLSGVEYDSVTSIRYLK